MSLISRTYHAHVGVGAGSGGSRVRYPTVATADLVHARRTAFPGTLPAARHRKRGKGISDTDPHTAAQLAAVADPWPEVAVIDMEGGGNGGAGRLSAKCTRQVFENDPLQGHDARTLARPYTLPG